MPGFIEGNAWNYSLYVPHDPDQMIKMMGGRAKFSAHLDELFTMHLPDSFFAETEDITREGIIGGYIHGNEPSHHVDTGDYIVVVNVEKLKVTGNKAQDKMYYRHTGYPGGINETNFAKLQQRFPGRILEKAVKGMLPKGPLGYAMLKKMKCYAGGVHPHTAPPARSATSPSSAPAPGPVSHRLNALNLSFEGCTIAPPRLP